ncbi:MAG: hypothetical protein ABJF11_04645 [Reichenbachiella sp.]|uniref:hypothetical protein n=1 Tax=Reichenbachiella sp. TaxID=2184521 RepID=UPI0032644713
MNDIYRNIAVIIEIGNSIKYLRNGLAEIQKISAVNDFYDPVLIFLSGGLERLFKSMLCLNFKELNNRLPNPGEIWNYKQGHDIEFLKSKIENICIPINRPFAQDDYDIITRDGTIIAICKALSKYGQKARYFNLDAILGTEQEFDSKKEWELIESEVLKDYYGEKEFYEMLGDPKKLDEIYLKSNHLLVSKIEVFLRAITRQFIFGDFSSDSKRFVFEIESFTKIEDNQIGTIDYRRFENHERIKR